MCGRYTLSASAEEITAAFAEDLNTVGAIDWSPRFNLAPSQLGVVIRSNDAGSAELTLMQWGLVPFWAKDRKIGAKLINARAETVAEKPAFRAAYRKRRCLVAADGYYEWAKRPGGKQPYFIHYPNRAIFGFAGLWEHWSDENGADLHTYTILTTEANADVKRLHHRMPLIVAPDKYRVWLDQRSKQDDLDALLATSADGTFEFDPISTYVNSPRNEGPDCIRVQQNTQASDA